MTIYIEPEYVTRIEDENEQLKNDLKIKNDIIKNTLTIDRDETEEYINKLQQELFNLYLKHYN